MRAAILREPNSDVEIVESMELTSPGPGQVKVRIRATGICHSDFSAVDGTLPIRLPVVLGHEGAGEVVEVGPGVVTPTVGDHVIVAWVPPCGVCRFCLNGEAQLCVGLRSAQRVPTFRLDGNPVPSFGGAGTFAEEVVLPAQSAVKIPVDVPWDIASLIGCAVTTGVGAALNTAGVVPGSSVVVFGAGGIGIAIIQGARIAGAAEIVAVDLNSSKLETARTFGATVAVLPDELPEIVAAATGGDGFDYAFEAVGKARTIRAAYDAARRGGRVVIVGIGSPTETVTFNPFELANTEKKILGSLYGSSDARTEFPRLIALWRTGRLDLERMISRRLDLCDVNDAFAAMRAGEHVRQVIMM